MEKLLEQTVAGVLKVGMKKHQLKRLVTDTTVQKKAVVFPTDAMIYPKMRLKLVKNVQLRKIIFWFLDFVQELQFSGRVAPLPYAA